MISNIFPEICSHSLVITCTVSILAFSIGTSMTWTSPVLPKLQDHTDNFFDEPISTEAASWIASSLSLGMAFGNIIYAILSKIIGRRICVISIPFIMTISHMMLSLLHHVEYYYAARFFSGMAVTGCMVVTNLYMTEVVDKSKRGSYIGFTASVAVLGFLYSFALGPYISVQAFNMSLLIYPIVFLILFFIFGIETPHYHVMKGETELARNALRKLRNRTDDIEQELKEIEQAIIETNKLDLFQLLQTRPSQIGFIVAFGLLFFQQLTGIYCLQTYTQQIFKMTGSNLDPMICPIIIGSLQFLSGFSASLVMERFPRKTLLYFSAVGMTMSELPLGIYCYLKNNLGINVDSWSFLPILTMSVFILTYNLAFGPLPFIIPSEIFPSACKGMATSIVGFVSSIITFLMAKYFQDIVDAVGIGILFMTFSACCALSIPFVKFFVVETRGKSLEEIQEDLTNSSSYLQK